MSRSRINNRSINNIISTSRSEIESGLIITTKSSWLIIINVDAVVVIIKPLIITRRSITTSGLQTK